MVLGDTTDDENEEMTAAEISVLSARLEDERSVCMVVMGKNLHDIYSNERIKMAVSRQSATMLMDAAASQSLVNAVPEAGALLTGPIGGQEEPRARASSESLPGGRRFAHRGSRRLEAGQC